EFAVLMPASSGRGEARAVAERIESALWRPLEVSGQRLRLGARVGHAVFPQDGENFDQLLSVASPGKEGRDERAWPLGLAGDSGRESGLSLEADLVDALERGEQFRVFYQPVARLEDDAVVGFEALLRWQHPERGLLDAGAFVPAAEQMGIIHELERVLLRQAVAEASRWTERSLPLWTSVNLSLTSLEGEEGGRLLADLVDASDLPPSRLVVEVTERITARNPAVARRRLEELHDLGFRIAIDDFGTGHSSLSYLQRFPLDLLKVDRSFVSRLSEEDEHQRLVEGILGLADGLDLDVVAEGVEVEGQRDWLRSAGCHQYQGYLLTRARPFGELDDLLENGGLSLGAGLAAEDRPA
ncbi:MAG: putative bifunctional diguanylate cyclase/phosphodiesterase, partial [Gemmatimonadota bacterium]